MTGRILGWVAGLLLLVLYGYLVIAAIGNLIGLREMAALLELELTGVGWFWLLLGIALPGVVLILALLLGRRRTAGQRVLVLAAGLCLVAAVQLEITHLVPTSTFFA